LRSPLRAAHTPKRLICVFQPHQHSRTRFLLDQFASSFTEANEIIVPAIYFVRDSEVDKTRVSAQDLVDRLLAKGKSAVHIANFDQIVEHLEQYSCDGDLIVTMGAGPVNTIAQDLLARGGAQTIYARAEAAEAVARPWRSRRASIRTSWSRRRRSTFRRRSTPRR
jgi:UDP-N-acetylmuramate-alanine ligase